MKRENHLFERLISDENLRLAIDEVNRTHHWHKGHKPNLCTAWVEETREERVAELRDIIVNGFEPKTPRAMRHWDASAQKWRTIHEPAQWPDQYVHHALIQILQPKMLRGMDHYCCGSIRGRGPYRASKAIERWMANDTKGTKYTLCADIRHFYDTLKPEVVMARMRQLYKDERVLDLVWRVVKDGVLIGGYTSQWFANTTLQPLDRLIRESGLCAHYTRYVDNFTIFGASKRKLRKLRGLIQKWLIQHGLELKDDWQVFPAAARLPDAVGYRYGRGYTIPRKRNLLRTKRAVARCRKRRNHVTAKAAASLLSRLGQLKHCNNYNIYRMLFQGERIMRELKKAVREWQRKESLTWSTFLEQRARLKSSRQKAALTPT